MRTEEDSSSGESSGAGGEASPTCWTSEYISNDKGSQWLVYWFLTKARQNGDQLSHADVAECGTRCRAQQRLTAYKHVLGNACTHADAGQRLRSDSPVRMVPKSTIRWGILDGREVEGCDSML